MLQKYSKKLAVLVAGLVSSTMIVAGANAAVVVGSLPDAPFSGGEIGSVFQSIMTPATPFAEIHSFTADEPIALTSTAEAIELNALLMISGFGFSLVENTAPANDFSSFTTLATGVDNGTGGLEFTFDGLIAGKFYGLLFEGTTGLAGGLYGGAFNVEPSTSVSNVPVPAAMPLFLTAITGLVLIARRRRQAA